MVGPHRVTGAHAAATRSLAHASDSQPTAEVAKLRRIADPVAMSATPTTPPFEAPSVTRPTSPLAQVLPAPDARELRSLAIGAGLVMLASAIDIGALVMQPWLPASTAALSTQDAVLIVVARFFPWIVGLIALAIPFSLRWMPRAHQRLVEPSLIAAWVTLFAAVAVAVVLGRYGLWPWRWASTNPEIASLLSNLAAQQHTAAVVLWVVMSCLLVPLLLELFFRFAALEWLKSRGVSINMAVVITAIAFGTISLLGLTVDTGAALRHAAFSTLFGLVLGAIVVRGKRGRGLGLAIIAHGAFAGVELAAFFGIGIT